MGSSEGERGGAVQVERESEASEEEGEGGIGGFRANLGVARSCPHTVPHHCPAFCLCPPFFADIEMRHGHAIPHGVTVPTCCLPFNSFAVFFFSVFTQASVLSLFFFFFFKEKLGLPPKKRLFKVLSLTVGVV